MLVEKKKLNGSYLEFAAKQSGRLSMPLGFEGCFCEADCEHVESSVALPEGG